MILLLLSVVAKLRSEFWAVMNGLIPILKRMVDGVFTLDALKISLKYPPLPKVFEAIFDGVTEAIDHLANGLSKIPFIVAADVTLDLFVLDPKLHHRVMPLDDALILPAKVIVFEGIRSPITNLPAAWKFTLLIQRLRKLMDFIKLPSFLRGAKTLLGGLWGKIVSLIFVAVNVVRMVALLLVLWNYVQLVQDRSNWPSWLSGALTQKNPRKKVVARLRRRIGGVAP